MFVDLGKAMKDRDNWVFGWSSRHAPFLRSSLIRLQLSMDCQFQISNHLSGFFQASAGRAVKMLQPRLARTVPEHKQFIEDTFWILNGTVASLTSCPSCVEFRTRPAEPYGYGMITLVQPTGLWGSNMFRHDTAPQV